MIRMSKQSAWSVRVTRVSQMAALLPLPGAHRGSGEALRQSVRAKL